mgnify:CR=1 FL=1
MTNKKAILLDPINIISSIIIIAGGVLVLLNYVNLGLLVTIIGTFFKAMEFVIKSGIK